ncbi:MAG: protein kinase [Chlamydiae bacterium]|nr:protein kinase [Chlamydiota bacterium]
MSTEIGNYQIIKSLAKGGMGEVFLAHDSICGRNVALKQIRKEYLQDQTIRDRFIREAKVAARLTHPSIISIYAMHQAADSLYYVMPYIEGETLKAIIRVTREQEKQGTALHPIGSNISALIRIFLQICEGIAYAHSKGIIHRDIKLENIIVGKYGEVIILDWGLADFIHSPEQTHESQEMAFPDEADLTIPGKVPGTLSYMAPERAFGEASSILSDIYSLGITLYYLLTLRPPFERQSLREFRKQFKNELFIPPEEIAPDRDIPPYLSDIAKKCLAPAKERYQTVIELIQDLERYIEGLPEWIKAAPLSMGKKEDWGFQATILLAKHMAITRQTDLMEWVNLMISKRSFRGNIKIETEIELKKASQGIGFLLALPDSCISKGTIEGYCLWIGSSINPGIKLYRASVEVVQFPDLFLPAEKKSAIRIEMVDHHIRLYLDNKLKISYLSHLPLIGTHIGILYRDDDFTLQELEIFSGSQNVMVNCLAVPNAFLTKKYFTEALSEYHQIASSFPGRAEGREAIFRSGTTLLEEGIRKKKKSEKHLYFSLALDEFEKLHGTPGAPLEYYGKALVYKEWGEVEEEVKCLELAIRKFPKHSLKPILFEYATARMHESAKTNRLAAFHFALLAVRHLVQIFSNPDHRELIDTLQKYLEPLPFFSTLQDRNRDIAIQLAFWLGKIQILLELFDKAESDQEKLNILYALLHLGKEEEVKKLSQRLEKISYQEEIQRSLARSEEVSTLPAISYLFESGIETEDFDLLEKIFQTMDETTFSPEENFYLKAQSIWKLLLEDRFDLVNQFFIDLPEGWKEQENHPLFFLYGCFLRKVQGEKAALTHFSAASETPFPSLSTLLAQFLLGKRKFEKKSLFFEKLQLYKQLALFYHCSGKKKLKISMNNKIKRLKQNV